MTSNPRRLKHMPDTAAHFVRWCFGASTKSVPIDRILADAGPQIRNGQTPREASPVTGHPSHVDLTMHCSCRCTGRVSP